MRPDLGEIEKRGKVNLTANALDEEMHQQQQHHQHLVEGQHGAAFNQSLTATGELREFSKDLQNVQSQLNAHRADFEAETGRAVPGAGLLPSKKGKSKSFSVGQGQRKYPKFHNPEMHLFKLPVNPPKKSEQSTYMRELAVPKGGELLDEDEIRKKA